MRFADRVGREGRSVPPEVRIEPGKVLVRFRPESVAGTFVALKDDRGLERLVLRTVEAAVLGDLGLVRVRRVHSQLEIKRDGRTEVLTDAELRKTLGKPNRPRGGDDAFVGIEREMILSFETQEAPQRICEQLTRLPAVEACRLLRLPVPFQRVVPNDPDFLQQWGFDNSAPGGPGQAPNFDIDAPEAWNLQQGNLSVVVAVLDRGIDITHADLYEKIWININELPAAFVTDANTLSSDGLPDILTFIDLNAFGADAATQTAMSALRTTWTLTDGNGNGYIDGEDLHNRFADGVDDDPLATSGEVDDIVGWDFREDDGLPPPEFHGTAVAGLVGATTDNLVHVAGVGWNVRILPVRHAEPAWRGIAYAKKHGAQVLTSSLGFVHTEPVEADRFRAETADLEDTGAVFSVALGNWERYFGGALFELQPYTIAVTSFQRVGVRDAHGGSAYSVYTDVAGPGAAAWSLTPGGSGSFSGTSAANPIVAGILGLMVAQRGDLKPEQLRQVLRAAAVDVPPVTGDRGENTAGYDYYAGWGLANALNALQLVQTDPWAEARVTTQGGTYLAPNREDELHIIGPASEVWAFAGLPGPTSSSVTLEHAPGPPPVPDAAWSAVASGMRPYLRDEMVATLTRSDLAAGPNTIRLTVANDGRTFQDFGRVDVPRAYMDIRDREVIEDDISIRGFAFHPDFARYELQVAVGHGVDEADDALWTQVGAAVPIARPPAADGNRFTDSELFATVAHAELPIGEATLRLAVFDTSGTRVASFPVPVFVIVPYPAQVGFPIAHDWMKGWRSLVAYDLDPGGDGKLELIFSNLVRVHIYDASGGELSWSPVDLPTGMGTFASPAVGDVTGDGIPEIVVRAADFLSGADTVIVISNNGATTAFDTGTSDPGFVADARIDQAPLLADLDADGDFEILLSGIGESPVQGVVRAFKCDAAAVCTLWRDYAPPGSDRVELPAVAGDIDGDGGLELAFVTSHGALGFPVNSHLNVYRDDGTPIVSDLSIGPSPVKALALADLDANGDLEILLIHGATVRAFHHDGSNVLGWEDVSISFTDGHFVTSLSGGQFAGTGGVSLFVTYLRGALGSTDYAVRVFTPDGTVAPGWNTVAMGNEGLPGPQPVVFDLDDDGSREVMTGPQQMLVPHTAVALRAFKADATEVSLPHFPIFLTYGFKRAPVIADLDRDGDLELAIAPWPLRVFDLDSADDAGAVAWGMEGHDPQRTNNYNGGIRLVLPSTAAPVTAGPAIAPWGRGSLNLRLRKELPTGHISQGDLSVRIGGVAAPVTQVTELGGDYHVLVDPPDQAGAGLYTAEVTWSDGGITRIARMKDAVRYTSCEILIDASGDGGTWWYPQSGTFDPNQDHQGKALADYLRSLGHDVTELPRPYTITAELLGDCGLVIRAGGFRGYSSDEITAYLDYVQGGGRLLLLGEHMINNPGDDLAAGFGLLFEGATQGENRMTNFTTHPISQGVGSVPYIVGAGLTSFPGTAQVIGSLSDLSYLDLDNSRTQDAAEPSAPPVLGVMDYGSGRIVFCGDVNMWQSVPQPLTDNVVNWLLAP